MEKALEKMLEQMIATGTGVIKLSPTKIVVSAAQMEVMRRMMDSQAFDSGKHIHEKAEQPRADTDTKKPRKRTRG